MRLFNVLMKLFIAIAVLVLAAACWFLFFRVPGESVPGDRVEIKVNNQTIIAEIAETAEEKERGLAGRTVLGANEGMLFPFSEKGSYGFWMKGMKIPIDIVWISGTTIIGFEENVPPPQNASVDDSELPTYLPPSPVDKVLELQARRAETLKLQKGDTITLIGRNDR